MLEVKECQPTKQNNETINNNNELDNIKRTLTMLEKAVNRNIRRNYYHPNQYPEIISQIEEGINTLRAWLSDYKIYSGLPMFHLHLGMTINDLGAIINQAMDIEPLPGKKAVKRKQISKEQMNLKKSISTMIEHIGSFLNKSEAATEMGLAFERALQKALEVDITKRHKKKTILPLSSRGEKTYIFPCTDNKQYMKIIYDRERFRIEVVKELDKYFHSTGHKPSCKGIKRYHLAGFRSHDRKTTMVNENEGPFPIRMVQCIECHERFSLLPSFLPREKHFGIDIIGHVFQNILLFSQSLQAVLANLKIIPKGVKSKQTILNWLYWIGALHPCTILTRAGVVGSGYFQEDEGFEKEPNLRTYSVFMVDSQNLLVWHADYIDHVDEESLCSSFEKFLQRLTFKILGVTKDKWEPSTNALKTVFHKIWIGFCHRHCLKKFREALNKYQEETQCSKKEITALYKKIKKILNSSHSEVILRIKIQSLDDEAFKHPLLKDRLAELKDNAVRYTSHKRRNGITKTTSLVDNLLKCVKRKLRMVESFRDKEYTRILFQALANTRNFVPFLSGAKNAHKSPFMLAQGQTYNLQWIQVMNVHNAFLFTPNAW